MYDFVEVNQQTTITPRATDSLMINGKFIEDTIPGYRHLYMAGRGLVSRMVDTTEVPLRDGVWVNYSQEEARYIKVTYELSGDDSRRLRSHYVELNKLLRSVDERGLLTIRFNDELDYYYRGLLESASEPAEQALSMIGEFTLLIPDAYKYKDPQQSNGQVTLLNALEVTPDEITVRTQGTNPITRVVIKNGRDEFVLVGNYRPNELIRIKWGDRLTVTYLGRSILNNIAVQSFPDRFKLRNGDVVTASGAVVESVKWSDKAL